MRVYNVNVGLVSYQGYMVLFGQCRTNDASYCSCAEYENSREGHCSSLLFASPVLASVDRVFFIIRMDSAKFLPLSKSRASFSHSRQTFFFRPSATSMSKGAHRTRLSTIVTFAF